MVASLDFRASAEHRSPTSIVLQRATSGIDRVKLQRAATFWCSVTRDKGA